MLARPPTAPPAGQCRLSSALEGPDPFADEAAIDPDGLGYLDPAGAGQRHIYGDAAQFSLRRRREFTEIAIYRHGSRITYP